jgi:hypothetical protein
MNSQQLQRRDEITQALWAIEDSMPVGSPEIHMAAERAIGELEELLQGVDPYANPLEAGRTWRYVGDACITSAGNEDAQGLAHAQRAYTTAEPLIEAGGDALEIAKLNFNHANALRLICHSQDRTMMEDASKRYLRSLKLFRTAMPSAVPKVENALQQTYAALSLLSMMESIQGSQDHTRELIERLQNAELSDAQVDREVERELDRLKTSDESPVGQLQELRTLLQQLVPMLAASDSPDQAAAFEQETRTDLAKPCGAWGIQGGPTLGFLQAGLAIGGALQSNALNGDTGVFINGRQLHRLDVVSLQQLGPVLPGRYWVDAMGNFGFEGGLKLGNLWMLARQRHATNPGSSGGAWAAHSGNVTVMGDGQGGVMADDGNSFWST